MRFKILFLFSLLLISLNISFAQTADEIIAKHIEAIGGADNWKKVNSMVMSGSMSMQGMEIALTRTVVHQAGFKNEISVMGMTGYQILTPTEGWNFMPFNGQTTPEPMTLDDVKEAQNELDAQGGVVNYAEKGHTLEYIGKEEVDGTECHKLKMIYKNGKSETMYLDPSTYYVVKSVAVQKGNGQEVEVTTTFSNYEKLAEGIVMPKSISLPWDPV